MLTITKEMWNYEYTIGIAHFDDEGNAQALTMLCIDDTKYAIINDYNLADKMICRTSIDNQDDLSKEEIDKGYLYADLLEQEIKKHIEHLLTCI